jgi:hypothetical protein
MFMNLMEQRKFYAGELVAFAKDRRRLLDWVVLWPASWLERKRGHRAGRALPANLHDGDDGRRHPRQRENQVSPGWLRQVIQSHFALHGDEYYAEAKSMRNLVENVVLMAGRPVAAQQPDPVREPAAARSLLAAPKRAVKPTKKEQLNLL